MENYIDDMTEVIAEAQAEEEVRAAQIKAKLEQPVTKVSVDIEEYVNLRMAFEDYKILVRYLFDDCLYNKYNQNLYIGHEHDTVITLLMVNFPELYAETFLRLKEEEEGKE